MKGSAAKWAVLMLAAAVAVFAFVLYKSLQYNQDGHGKGGESNGGQSAKPAQTAFQNFKVESGKALVYKLRIEGVMQTMHNGKEAKQVGKGSGTLTLSFLKENVVKAAASEIEIDYKGYEGGVEVASEKKKDSKISGKTAYLMLGSESEVLGFWHDGQSAWFEALIDSIVFQNRVLEQWMQTNADAQGAYKAFYKRGEAFISKKKSYLPNGLIPPMYGEVFVTGKIENGRMKKIEYSMEVKQKQKVGNVETNLPIQGSEKFSFELDRVENTREELPSNIEEELKKSAAAIEKLLANLGKPKDEWDNDGNPEVPVEEVMREVKRIVMSMNKHGDSRDWVAIAHCLEANPAAVNEAIKMLDDTSLAFEMRVGLAKGIGNAEAKQVENTFMDFLRKAKRAVDEGKREKDFLKIRNAGMRSLDHDHNSKITDYLLEVLFDKSEEQDAKESTLASMADITWTKGDEEKDFETAEFLAYQALAFFKTTEEHMTPGTKFSAGDYYGDAKRAALDVISIFYEALYNSHRDTTIVEKMYFEAFDTLKSIPNHGNGDYWEVFDRLGTLLGNFEDEKAKAIVKEIQEINKPD